MTIRIHFTSFSFNALSVCGALVSLGCSPDVSEVSGTGGGSTLATGGSVQTNTGGQTAGSGGQGAGGLNIGGAATGGQGSGGLLTGGTSSGGASAGGSTSGGAATGGASAGGSTSGGAASGGAGSGGGSSTSSCEGGVAPGFYVEDGKLYDDHCNEFVMRGANVSHAWFKDETPSSLGNLASVGGNAVRIVMATGGRWDRTGGSEVSNLIDWAKSNQLVAMLEVHDSTGYAEQAGSEHPQNAVDYWTSEDVKSALIGQEAFVLINIANEAFGNDTTSQWQSFHEGAVADLRAAGLNHTLVVDAPNWGQDHTETMKNGGAARSIFDADPDKNVVFSVHMYDIYSSSNTISSYMQAFADKGLPLVVGEFASDHGADKPIDEEAIMDYAGVFGFGYLGWSWSGNGDGLGSLDITQSFDLNNLTPWGDALINGPYGLKATSEICTCFE